MRAIRLFTLAASVVTAALLFSPVAQAQKNGKTKMTTLKLGNLTKETKAKDAKKLEKAVKKVKGVSVVIVAKKKGEVKIKHKTTTKVEDIKAAITKAGFTIATSEEDDESPPEEPTPSPEPEEDSEDDESFEDDI